MEQGFLAWLNSLQPWLVNMINSGENLESSEAVSKGADLCIEQVNNNVKLKGTIKRIDEEHSSRIVVERIHSTSNLFALRDNMQMDFSSRITAVYGANGAGKTSVVKLLDYANGGNVDLARNRFKKRKGKQKYTIDYTDNGIKKSFVLENNKDRINLDIFDGERGNRILTDGKTLSVEAVELKMLQDLTSFCDNVKNELKSRNETVVQSKEIVPIPSQFKDSDAEKTWNTLIESEIEEFEKIVAGIEWTEDNQKILDKTIAELNEDNRIRIIGELENRINNIGAAITSIESIIESFDDEAFKEIESQKERLLNAYNTSKEYSDSIFDKSELGDIGTDTWKRMWTAARNYSALVYPENSFPVVEPNARCVLCHQPLTEDARDRLQGFEEYVNSSFEEELRVAQRVVENNHLLKLNVNIELINEKLHAAMGDDYQGECKGAIDELLQIDSWAKDQKQIDVPFKPIEFNECNKMVNTFKSTLERLEKEKEGIINDEKYEKIEQERRILEGKKWIATQITTLKKNTQFNTESRVILNAIRLTSTNRLTSKAKELSENLLTQNYETAFNGALELLGANNLHARLIAGKGKKGRGSFQIVLENDEGERINAGDVLSTGEQRIVSLAAFIADAVNRKDEVPFIFDDPVSSLDSDYERKVANALYALAENRQVIIFTHRLSLMSALSEHGNIEFAEIYRSDPIGCGVIDYNPTITFTSPKDIKKSLKELRNRLQELDKEMNDAPNVKGYRERIDGIVAKFRTIIESTIEIVLLDGIVTRFNREVRSKKVKRLASISLDECEIVDGLMSKYSEKVHSQSTEHPNKAISSEDVQEDINIMIELIDNHNKQKN